jgi:vanillate/3-O-methylgallate O-demethylase
VGVSTGRTVSPTLRAMISLCVIDRAHAVPGTKVTVIWGRPGTPQREIRATVTALPFKPDHRRVDVTSL